jgi:hypothetical protein
MIYINHNKKAIFIHIPKTGGSYIGPTLVKYYGFICFLDLINQKRPDHDEICQTNKYPKILTGKHIYDNSFFNKHVGILLYCKTSPYFNKIMNMDEEKWTTYTKFCFIRHPYDRAVSGFNHINNILNGDKIELSNYIKQNPFNVSDIEYGHIFMSQTKHIINENDECFVDIIGRFEHLETDFITILNKIGFTSPIHVPKKKNVSNKNNSNVLTISIYAMKILNTLFLDDFTNFHYKSPLK